MNFPKLIFSAILTIYVSSTLFAQDEWDDYVDFGKLRGHLRAPKDADKATVERLALAHEAVQRFSEGRVPKQVVVVPGRLVNVVV